MLLFMWNLIFARQKRNIVVFTVLLAVCLWCLDCFYFWLRDSVHVWFVPVCVCVYEETDNAQNTVASL